MTNEQIEEAHQLREQGYSIRDIEKKIVPKVSRSTLDRMFHADAPIISETPAPAFGKRPVTAETVELGKLDLTLTHERKMAELEIRKEEQALQRRQMELDSERVKNEQRLLNIREQQFDREQQENEDRVRNQKELLTGKFNRVIRELLKNCQDATWSEEEVDDYLERAKALKTKVGRFCEKHVVDEDGLAIWHNMADLTKLIEQTKEDNTSFFGSNVSFDFEKKQIQQIKSWLTEEFDALYTKPTKESTANIDEDQDDENDDQDDEKSRNDFEKESELVSAFNELVAILAGNCDNEDWTIAEYKEYIASIETFQEELTDYIETLDKSFDADKQAIIVCTEELLDFVVERTAIVKETGNKLTLHVKGDAKKWLDDLSLDDFWVEIEEDD
ncbi:hypothetical protein LC612_38135 [Nostoc sp. CHAB 5834]|nr:hypothetical protein [Nostoc sp. CHAB 5834]